MHRVNRDLAASSISVDDGKHVPERPQGRPERQQEETRFHCAFLFGILGLIAYKNHGRMQDHNPPDVVPGRLALIGVLITAACIYVWWARFKVTEQTKRKSYLYGKC